VTRANGWRLRYAPVSPRSPSEIPSFIVTRYAEPSEREDSTAPVPLPIVSAEELPGGVRALFRSRSLARAAVTSALATASDFTAANLLHGAHVPAGGATFLGCVVGGIVAFLVHRIWAFGARDYSAGPQLFRFLLVWALSAFLNSAGVELVLHDAGGFGAAWVMVRGSVYVFVNYPLLRWFVFPVARGARERA
jgi:putative flippase GtrA